MTVWEAIESGEYVMFALAALLLASLIIWIVTAAKLRKEKRAINPLMQRVRDLVTEGDIDNSLQLCQSSPASAARIVEAGLTHLGKHIAEVKSAMRYVADIEKNNLGKGGVWIKTIAFISPLIGFGGTLIGIINRMEWLAVVEPEADIPLFCEVVAPTLVTTVAGLVAAVCSYFAYTCLKTQINSSKNQIDKLTMDMTDLLNEPAR